MVGPVILRSDRDAVGVLQLPERTLDVVLSANKRIPKVLPALLGRMRRAVALAATVRQSASGSSARVGRWPMRLGIRDPDGDPAPIGPAQRSKSSSPRPLRRKHSTDSTSLGNSISIAAQTMSLLIS